MFRKLLDRGEAGDNVGVLLRGIDRDGVERGQVLSKPKSVTPHTSSRPRLYPDQGRGAATRRSSPTTAAVLLPLTTDVTGRSSCRRHEMVMPGDNLKFNVE